MRAKNTQVKICGLTKPEEVRWVVEERADYFGIVLFFTKSKRNNSIENARKLIETCHKECAEKKSADEHFTPPVIVAVTVSPTPEQIKEIEDAGFDMVQIHGELSEETLDTVSIPVIRAFHAGDTEACKKYDNCPKITAYLFDAQNPGSGRTFDWKVLDTVSGERTLRDGKKIFLAGGLHGGNVREAIEHVHPDVVDVSSGVEKDAATADGAVIKDREKIKEFIRKVRTDE